MSAFTLSGPAPGDVGSGGFYRVRAPQRAWTHALRQSCRATVLQAAGMVRAEGVKPTLSVVAGHQVGNRGGGLPGHCRQEIDAVPSVAWFDRCEMLRWKGEGCRRAYVLAVQPCTLSESMVRGLREEVARQGLEVGVFPYSSWANPGGALVLIAPRGVLPAAVVGREEESR